jgi:hypothetical protein
VSDTTTAERIRRQRVEDGQLLRLTLDLGKGNVIDLAAIDELRSIVEETRAVSGLKGLIIDHAGDHFSFGASVEDHLPGRVEEMLPKFHCLAKEMLALDLPVLAAARGQCLGGGLEVARDADGQIRPAGDSPGGLRPGRLAPVAAPDRQDPRRRPVALRSLTRRGRSEEHRPDRRDHQRPAGRHGRLGSPAPAGEERCRAAPGDPSQSSRVGAAVRPRSG